MIKELSRIELALLDELTARNATMQEIAEYFPNLRLTDVTANSPHFVGNYRRWTIEQEDFIYERAMDRLSLADMQAEFEDHFGFSRSEGALVSRLKKIGITDYKKITEFHNIEKARVARRLEKLARPGFQKYMR